MSLHEKLIRVFPAMVLELKVSNRLQWLNAIKDMVALRGSGMGGTEFTKFIKAFIPSFRWKEWTKELGEAREKREKRKIAKHVPVVSSPHKLAFSQLYWESKGRPFFGKKIVSGIQWGTGQVKDNGKWGWKKVIQSRYLGLMIKHKENGHVGLVIVCPD